MKLSIVLAVAASLLAYSGYTKVFSSDEIARVPLGVSLAFQNWRQNNSKDYASPEESEFRLRNFYKTFDLVQAHNSRKGVNYRMELNQFSDLTDEEISGMYLGWKPERELKLAYPATQSSVRADLQDVPSSVDWKSNGIVSAQVLNQGSCGACWAFAAAAAAESDYNRSFKTKNQFSPQQLINCSTGGDCKGGLYTTALGFYKKYSACSSTAYKYVGVQGFCDSSKDTISFKKATGTYEIKDSFSSFLLEVSKRPIAYGQAMNRNAMQYKEGIFDDSTCFSSKLGYHAMTLVGYNRDEKYWLVKNSYGETFGDKGYFRIKMEENDTGLCNMYMLGGVVKYSD